MTATDRKLQVKDAEKTESGISTERYIKQFFEERPKQKEALRSAFSQKNSRKKFLTRNHKPDKISLAHAEVILPKSVMRNTGEVSKRS